MSTAQQTRPTTAEQVSSTLVSVGSPASTRPRTSSSACAPPSRRSRAAGSTARCSSWTTPPRTTPPRSPPPPGRAWCGRAQTGLRQRLPRRLRRRARALHRDGRRRSDLRLQRDPPLRRGARGGRGARDGRPHGQHPSRRDALAAPLRRQPHSHGPAQHVLQHRRQRRPLRDARAAPRRAPPPGPAHHRHGVRLRDGDPCLQGEPADRGVPDRVPPPRRGVEALELPRRLAPPALPARAQPHPPLHPPRRPARRPRHADRRARRRGPGLLRALLGPARPDRRGPADDRGHPDPRAGTLRPRLRHLLHGRPRPLVRPHARALSPPSTACCSAAPSCSSGSPWAP